MRARPHPVARRRAIAALEAFVAAGAVHGGVNLLADAEAFGMRESWLAGTPFPDYTVPGLALLLGIGGGMAVAAVLALRGHRLADLAALVMGTALLAFLVIETAVLGYRGPMQLILLVAMGVPALALIRAGRPAVHGPHAGRRGPAAPGT